jgi:hypothetical protein
VDPLRYGNWDSHTPAEWSEQYRQHDRDVARFFEGTGRGAQLLNVSFTEGGGWEELGPHLGVDAPPGPPPGWGGGKGGGKGEGEGEGKGEGNEGAEDKAGEEGTGEGGRFAFPRADVFDVSANLQPRWQMRNLLQWAGL